MYYTIDEGLHHSTVHEIVNLKARFHEVGHLPHVHLSAACACCHLIKASLSAIS